MNPRGFWAEAVTQPEAVAVIDPDGAVTTRGELLDRVQRVAGHLHRAGLRLDDRYAVLVRNSVRYFEWVLAGTQLGLHPVPLNYHLVADEIGYIVDNSSSRLVAVAEPLIELADAALAGIAFSGERVALDRAPGYVPYADVLAGPPLDPDEPRLSGSVMLYTAGTTGRPKGVLWPARPEVSPEMAVAATAPMIARRGMSLGGVSLVCGPLYHGAPGSQGMQALHWGQSVVMMGHWDSEQALALIERYQVTHVQMAPIHFHRLLQLPDDVRARYDLSSLRAVTHAGAGCPLDVKQRMMDWFGPVLYEYYAASEGFGTSITPEQWLAHPGSVGHMASDGATIEIVDDDGAVLPPGEIGMVYLQVPGAGDSQYLGDPEKTAAARRDGGFRTFGDMGYLDADGWLYLVDRRSDMILSGGVNVYPAEIESRLRVHRSVADVAVIGIPDAEWGQLVLAVVVPAEGVQPGPELEAELARYCEAGLARFKCPRRWDFRDELPYSGPGKLLRRELRDPYWH